MALGLNGLDAYICLNLAPGFISLLHALHFPTLGYELSLRIGRRDDRLAQPTTLFPIACWAVRVLLANLTVANARKQSGHALKVDWLQDPTVHSLLDHV